MRIDASTLAAEGFRYVSPTAGAPNEVVLGPSGGVTGYYEGVAARHTVDAQAHLLVARSARWRVGDGEIAIEDTARLQHVFLKLAVPPGDGETELRLGADSAELFSCSYRSEGFCLDARARLAGALVERDATGKLTIVAVSASLQDVVVRAGQLELRAEIARARKLSLAAERGIVELAVEGLDLERASLALQDVHLDVDRVAVDGGLRYRGGSLEIGSLALADLRADVAIPTSDEEPSTEPATARALPDLPALDRIDGTVAADLHVMAALPVVKDRGATHGLRIPIDRGVISFGELEDGLSGVVNALIDFEVEPDAVKVELDVIPFLKSDNVTLLRWPLTEQVDRELAAQKSMRLRTLLRFERPPTDEPRKRDGGGLVRLVSLDVEHVDVHLSARAPVEIPIGGGIIRLDDGEGHAVRSLDVRGDVHLTLEGEPKRGVLEAAMAGVVGEVCDLAIGTSRLMRAKVAVPHFDRLIARFDGARPVRVEAEVSSVRLDGVAVALTARGSDAPQSEHTASQAARPAA